MLDAFGNRGKVIDVFPGRGGFYKVQYPDGSTGYVDIKDARSSRSAPKQNPKRPKPSEQSRLYAAAADLHRQALAAGDRAAIQRANALWAQGHSARRNPKPGAGVTFSKPVTYSGRKRVEARLTDAAWDGPKVRIEQVYGISKHGATRGQRTGPADLWACSRTGMAPGTVLAQGSLREMKNYAASYLRGAA